MLRHLATYLIAICCIVGCSPVADNTTIVDELPAHNLTIAELRHDVVTPRGVQLTHDIVLRGRVTSSDEEQNHYRTLTIEDATGAVELMAGGYNLHSLYPEGLEVALLLEGCYAQLVEGTIQIGNRGESYDYYPVDYLASRQAMDRVVRRGQSVEPITPPSVRLAELTEQMCGRLLRIEELHLVAAESVDTLAGMSLEDAIWRGATLFKDAAGDSIALYTRAAAHFATEQIPSTPLSLTGTLYRARYNGRVCYHLKMRYATDCSTR